jgi:prophage tail gpP-like protein
MITVEIAGKKYTGFKNITVSQSMPNLSGEFTLSTVTTGKAFPFTNGDICRIFIGNEQVLDGYIERIRINHNHTEHDIEISGRDKTCDVVDSSISGNLRFSATTSLIEISKKVLQSLNINNIDVFSTVDIESFGNGEVISSEIGESAFDFLEKYARKRQVLLTNDGSGNLLYTRTSTDIISTKLIYGDTTSNILSASAEFDNSKRFNKYIVHSQINNSAINDSSNYISSDKSTDITASSTDSDIRTSRIFNFHGETCINSNDVKKRSIWEANIRRAKAFKYNCTLQGFVAQVDKKAWRPNMLVTVIDTDCNIDSQLLVNSVSFKYSLDGGSITELELVSKDSFDIIEIEGTRASKKKKERFEGERFAG